RLFHRDATRRIEQVAHRLAAGAQLAVHRDAVFARLVREIHRHQYFLGVEDARVSERAAAVERMAEVATVAGDLAKILPPVAQRRLRAPDRGDRADAAIDFMVRVEEVTAGGAEGAPGAAEHALAHVAVVRAAAVEALFGAIVKTGNALRGQEISNGQQRLARMR